jgi:hypothetical protein
MKIKKSICLEKKCLNCDNVFTNVRKSNGYYVGNIQFSKTKFCSTRCAALYSHPWGLTEEQRAKGIATRKKNGSYTSWNKGKKGFLSGVKHYNWKGGISIATHGTSNPEYREWRTSVFKRDNWKCKMFNKDCNGMLQAHHILRWSEYPELRYDINNGITLCIKHHPRKKNDEMQLTPYFRTLIDTTT